MYIHLHLYFHLYFISKHICLFVFVPIVVPWLSNQIPTGYFLLSAHWALVLELEFAVRFQQACQTKENTKIRPLVMVETKNRTTTKPQMIFKVIKLSVQGSLRMRVFSRQEEFQIKRNLLKRNVDNSSTAGWSVLCVFSFSLFFFFFENAGIFEWGIRNRTRASNTAPTCLNAGPAIQRCHLTA